MCGIEDDLPAMRDAVEELMNFEVEEIKKEHARVKRLCDRIEFFMLALVNLEDGLISDSERRSV